MNKKVLLGFSVLLVAIQIYNANSQQDPRIKKCKEKFLEQAKKINFSQLPSCFDADQLEAAKNNAHVFGELFNNLPQECKRPTASVVTDCLSFSFNYLKGHSKEVQAGISGSLNALFAATKGCIDLAVNQFSGLNEYIYNGCPDNSTGN